MLKRTPSSTKSLFNASAPLNPCCLAILLASALPLIFLKLLLAELALPPKPAALLFIPAAPITAFIDHSIISTSRATSWANLGSFGLIPSISILCSAALMVLSRALSKFDCRQSITPLPALLTTFCIPCKLMDIGGVLLLTAGISRVDATLAIGIGPEDEKLGNGLGPEDVRLDIGLGPEDVKLDIGLGPEDAKLDIGLGPEGEAAALQLCLGSTESQLLLPQLSLLPQLLLPNLLLPQLPPPKDDPEDLEDPEDPDGLKLDAIPALAFLRPFDAVFTIAEIGNHILPSKST